jgi:hypothetical protein
LDTAELVLGTLRIVKEASVLQDVHSVFSATAVVR